VDKEITKEDLLSVYFNEATTINHQRIYNISVTTRRGAFYYHNTSFRPNTASAAYITEKIIKALDVIINNQLSRINSISADTYSVMLKSFDKIKIQPGLKHCFFISYNSHGL
jgi:hypothetical protein